MDDDMNATPLSKLPPPLVQSRRPEPPPQGLSPAVPSGGARRAKDVSAPTYSELLREMDASMPPPSQDQETYEDNYHEPQPSTQYQQQQPPQQLPRSSRGGEPQEVRPGREAQRNTPAATPPRAGGLLWRHRSTILVAVIVAVMLLYGVPKLQTAAPSLFSPMTMYKLNVTGAAVVAASAAGIHATLATYVLM